MAEEKTEQQSQQNAGDGAKTKDQPAEKVATGSPEKKTAGAEVMNGEGDQQQQPKENGKQSPEPPKDMRAIVLSGYGGLKCVKALRKPEPTLAEGEVLIKVKSCGLNFMDVMARQGILDSVAKTPCILGFECAGDIEQVGEGVENFKVGDKVVALPDHKAWAEFVAVPATSVYALPPGMSYEDATAITLNYTVAYILLFKLADLTPGNSILLHSAGGGVGQAIVQLAKTVKDTKIFGVCSKSKHETLKQAGTIDHLLERGTDYKATVEKEVPAGLDIVLDCMYGEDCKKGYALLKPMGRYILYGLSNSSENKNLSAARFWWQVGKYPPIKHFEENKTMSGFNLRHLLYQQGQHEYIRQVVNKVFKLWSEGKIKPVIDSTFALEDVTEAMQKLHEHKNIGKILIDPSMEPKPKPVTPAKTKSKDKKSAAQEEKKNSEEGEKKKEPEMTNGTTEEKSDTDSKEKETS